MPKIQNPKSKIQNGLPLIRASELTQYSFCQRAWWLRTVKKIQPENQAGLIRGRQAHIRHERQVRLATRWCGIGFLLISAGGLFLIAMLFWFWLAGF